MLKHGIILEERDFALSFLECVLLLSRFVRYKLFICQI